MDITETTIIGSVTPGGKLDWRSVVLDRIGKRMNRVRPDNNTVTYAATWTDGSTLTVTLDPPASGDIAFDDPALAPEA